MSLKTRVFQIMGPAVLATTALVAHAFAQAPAGQGQSTSPAPSRGAVPQTSAPASAPITDAEFVRQAADGGMKEVELNRIAAKQALNADVKALAAKLLADHEKANAELTALAKKEKIDTGHAGMPGMHKADTDKLAALSGPAFDRTYLTDLVAAHQKSIALFESEVRSGTNGQIKAWAQATLPTLREHLQEAQAVQAKVK
jgi:putative membrane protein